MKQYIVLFEKNKAVAAQQLVRPGDVLELARNNSHTVDWLVVFGEDPKEAIRVAEQLHNDQNRVA